MSPYFSKNYAASLDNDVSMAVLSILNWHPIPPKLNHTFVVLISKKSKPELITEFQPVSLYSVVYKLVTKVPSNHLKPILLAMIFENQGAFVQCLLIFDNILIAFESYIL